MAAYFIAAILFLGMRYWILPNIDTWRPQLEQQLSAALSTPVSLGHIGADWKGLNPRFDMSDVVLRDADDQVLFTVPHVQAKLSWRSILALEPRFLSIEARGVDLTLRRDIDRRIWVMGKSFDLDQSESLRPSPDKRVLAWLAALPTVSLRDATLRWVDEFRAAQPLVLQDVNLMIRNHGYEHQFSLAAAPPPSTGQSLDMRGQFHRVPTDDPAHFSMETLEGRLYARIEDMRPMAWAPWLDLPQNLESGRVSAQAWLDLKDGGIEQFTAELGIESGRWALGDGAHARTDALSMRVAGPWEGAGPSFPAVRYQLLAEGLLLDAPNVFERPLSFGHIEAAGMLEGRADHTLHVSADTLNVRNDDVEASLKGHWEQGGSSRFGLIDLKGTFERARIDAIDDYLPNIVNLEAREWMAQGLVGGQIDDGRLTLRGDLDFFPFQEDRTKGEFLVQGHYTGGIIDYLPADGKTLGWPRLTDMRGMAVLDRADLRLHADQATIWPAPDQAIELWDVSARIRDIEQESVLSITGNTRASATTYLALIKHSPLGGMLDGLFDEAKGDGTLEVPLTLTIPLVNAEQTTVEGAVQFAGAMLSMAPDLPPFEQIDGRLVFSDTVVSADGLKASFLGGPVTLNGGFGGASHGLRLDGRATAKALNDYVGVAGMDRLKGSLAYKAVLQRRASRGLELTVESSLSGMAIDLPPPLGKSQASSLPLSVQWGRHTDGKSMALSATLGESVSATLLHRPGSKGGAYFHAASVGVQQKPELPASGLAVDAKFASIDIGQWSEVIAGFGAPASAKAKQGGRALIPDLQQLRLQATQAELHGITLDNLTFTARQPEPAHWRVDISSSQTAGTLFWREAEKRIAGRVEAKFDRLAVGRETPADPAAADTSKDEGFDLDDELDIPAIDLHVKNFRLYGRDVGELTVSGVNQARGRRWRLEKLKLVHPAATITGSGLWRLSGKNRGLTLDAVADIKDVGAYLDQIGVKDAMKGGEGTIKGQVEWRNMPWRFSKADLNGVAEFQLRKGRFSSLNSHSARLLELLSLQSMKRLAKFDFNPAGLAKEGFPYDNLRGTVHLDEGVMSTSNYRVTGPIGTIVMGGSVNLIHEKLDLEAVVIPNLDVSGAAIAAGIAINPIVGVGAFLTQWLLQAPLAKAMTVEYKIGGTWEEPSIKEVGSRSEREKGAAANLPPVTP
ncbi:TIGR02099 family protein [Parapusillimonas sp. SGNA-6]|nr:TIGR02099 family protein [Parapusillimonas sp. SGNA-6]